MQEWKLSSINLSSIQRIKDVFESNAPTLGLIKREYGKEFMITYISMWVNEINRFAGGKMEEYECDLTAETIFNDFYFLNIADLKLITKRLNKRKFIRVSGNEIYNEIELYFNERCIEAQSYNQKKSDDYKQSLVKPELDDEQLKGLYKSVKSGEELSKSVDIVKRRSEIEKQKNKEARELYKAGKL